MKPFTQQNYYEILDLPYDARPSEIRDAYKAALEIYKADSLVSYSFFTEDERGKILSRLEEAFLTLINSERRAQYDEALIHRGELTAEMQLRKTRDVPIFVTAHKRTHSPARATSTGKAKKVKTKAAPKEAVQALLDKDVVTGDDLRQMRSDLGIPLESISGKTKIRIVFLRALEEDRFDELPSPFHLKSFLKAYLQCFSIDPDPIVAKYSKRLEGERKKEKC